MLAASPRHIDLILDSPEPPQPGSPGSRIAFPRGSQGVSYGRVGDHRRGWPSRRISAGGLPIILGLALLLIKVPSSNSKKSPSSLNFDSCFAALTLSQTGRPERAIIPGAILEMSARKSCGQLSWDVEWKGRRPSSGGSEEKRQRDGRAGAAISGGDTARGPSERASAKLVSPELGDIGEST